MRWTFAAIAATMVVTGTTPTFAAPRHHHAASIYAPGMPSQSAAGQNRLMGYSPTNPTESSERDVNFVASEVGRSLINGIILGGHVGPYLSGLDPAHIRSRVTASDYAPAR